MARRRYTNSTPQAQTPGSASETQTNPNNCQARSSTITDAGNACNSNVCGSMTESSVPPPIAECNFKLQTNLAGSSDSAMLQQRDPRAGPGCPKAKETHFHFQ